MIQETSRAARCNPTLIKHQFRPFLGETPHSMQLTRHQDYQVPISHKRGSQEEARRAAQSRLVQLHMQSVFLEERQQRSLLVHAVIYMHVLGPTHRPLVLASCKPIAL